MWQLFLLFAVAFVLTAQGEQPDCGVNVVLEDTFKRRNGQSEPLSANLTRREYSAAEILPWVVSFGRYEEARNQWKHFCGGSIIGVDLVLTAHHCLKEIGENGFVRAGDSDHNKADDDEPVQIVKVVENFVHPLRDASSDSAFFDLVVLRVEPSFKFTNTVRQICLPVQSRDETEAEKRQGEGVTVAGFGETVKGNPSTSGELLNTLVTIRPEDYCRRIYLLANEKYRAFKGLNNTNDSAQSTPVKIQEAKIETESERANNESKIYDPESSDDRVKRQSDESFDPPKKAPPTAEEKQMRIEIANRLVPHAFNSSIMCIGSELNGIGACKGDEGGPGFIFDTGDDFSSEKYVQIAVFSGSVGCGVAAFPDIYVRLEEPSTLEWLRQFAL